MKPEKNKSKVSKKTKPEDDKKFDANKIKITNKVFDANKFKSMVVKDFRTKFNKLGIDADAEDAEDELDAETEKIKNSKIYRKYENAWNKFAAQCESNNILARADFTCCNSCGNAEIEDVKDECEKTNNKKYLAYVFYHVQETDRIYDQCRNNSKEISAYLGWSYFEQDDEIDDEIVDKNCIKLAEKIHKIAVDAGYDLEYSDASQKLLFKVKV